MRTAVEKAGMSKPSRSPRESSSCTPLPVAPRLHTLFGSVPGKLWPSVCPSKCPSRKAFAIRPFVS